MVSIDTAVVSSSLIYLILLEMVSFARTSETRESPRNGHIYDTLDYDVRLLGSKYRRYLPNFPIEIRFSGYSSHLMSKGQFGLIFVLTELACMASLFAFFAFNIDNPVISWVLLVPVWGIWTFLPILVIPEYTELIEAKKRPRSADIHILYVVVLLPLLISSTFIFERASSFDTFLRLTASMVPIAFALLLYSLKIHHFNKYLQTELEWLRP